MAEKIELPTTQRAYTLRLRGPTKDDNSWRDALWATHEAVNKGAKVFGDWLLTLRGGMDHTLAGNDPDRRIVLALSWLSVESQRGAPDAKFLVAPDETVNTLRAILATRGLGDQEIEKWLKDCRPSLGARIRDDACWVNRSDVFNQWCSVQDRAKAREDARKILSYLFNKDYLTLPRKQKKAAPKNKADAVREEPGSEGEEAEEKRGAAIQSGKGAAQRTRHLFSHVLGGKADSKGFGKPAARLDLRDWWQQQLGPLVVNQCGIPLSGATSKQLNGSHSPTELHREMLSKAAARLAQIHTKQKQQEVERQQRQTADDELRKLEADSSYTDVLTKLDGFYKNRAARLRQIEQWDRVVRGWAKIDENDPTTAGNRRIETAEQLQAELRDEKFGDINLFIALADEDFKCVWWHKGQADPSILRAYVKGNKARADAERLKVASYRHPEVYENPVFCQFGVSRPHIAFRRLAAIKSLEPAAKDIRAVEMLLWDGTQAKRRILLASGKRFDREIGSACDLAVEDSADVPVVSRRTRLGGFDLPNYNDRLRTHVSGVFDPKRIMSRGNDESDDDGDDDGKLKEPAWNGTLQCERRALRAIGKAEAAGRQRGHLHWSLIVSLALQSRGPWCGFVNDHNDVIEPDQAYDRDSKRKAWRLAPKKNKDTWRGTAYPFAHSGNTNDRGTMSYHLLSRLPRLRVLSVDLGHRYAAACAVWETLTAEQMKGACQAANHAPPTESDMFIHLSRPTEKIVKKGRKKGQKVVETVIYRRIGADHIDVPDMTTGQVKPEPHPAPWARLDRQFLIKLQGEDETPRKPAPEEIQRLKQLDAEVGRISPEDRSFNVGKLMAGAVRTVRLALRRHGDYGRMAWGLIADHKPMPGGNKDPFTPQPGDSPDQIEQRREKHIAYLQDILMLWYDLAHSTDWKDEWAARQWKDHIAALPEYKEPSQPDDQATGPQRRKQREQMRDSFKDLAVPLLSQNRKAISDLWKARWDEADVKWTDRLKWLRGWILPRNLANPKKTETIEHWRQRVAAARHVGGLSQPRINTIRGLWQVYKAFRYRPTPTDTRAGVALIEKDAAEGRKFGDRILQAMEHMREQRVKQLASRIVEAALGIGSENRQKHWEGGTKRPRHRVFDPCHAVVIENLTNYRPDELQTRRENRQLMSWSSSKVKKYLSEGCQLHGLHLREISPGYTSRQDSRTGAPAIRCDDVAVNDFLTKDWWRKPVSAARKKVNDGEGGTAEERLFVDLDKHWCERWGKMSQADMKACVPLRLPRKGGDLAVSTDGRSLQADLNAAANIGLRALLDPDWAGRWWYVPCETSTGKPVADKVKGSAAVPLDQPLSGVSPKKGKRDKDVLNLWRNCSSEPLLPGQFKPYDAYWNAVKCDIARLLRKHNGLAEIT